MGSQRRAFTEQMGLQRGLEGWGISKVRRIRQFPGMEEVRISKVGVAKEMKRRYHGRSRDSTYVNIERTCHRGRWNILGCQL